MVFGVAETLFVALRSWSPDLLQLWSVLLLVVVVAVVIGWVGAEIVLDRRPPEWTWFITALATAPAAGLLSWILLALLVDGTGVADLQAALVGRASFTALLILAAVFVGSRLGWLSLRRHGEGADDPMLDADDEELERELSRDRGDERAPSAARAAARVGVVPTGVAPAADPAIAGVRTPRRRSEERSPSGPEIAERERMPEAPRLAGQRRASTVRPAALEPAPDPAPEPASSPFGATPDTPSGDRPESLEPPVVAVLPAFPRPGGPLDATGSQPAVDDSPDSPSASAPEEPERGSRRKFGLRRPKS